MATLLEVRQDSLLSLGDGNAPPQALLRMGIAPVATKWDLFALQGRMFNAHQTTIGTALNGGTADAGGIVLTAPFFRFTVPSGLTVFPRRFNWTFATLPGTMNEIAIAYSVGDTFTSGGTAHTPLNWRTDNPRATAVTNCYIGPSGGANVEAALVTPRVLYQKTIPLAASFASSYTLETTIDVWWDALVPIVGPAAFLVYLGNVTTTSTGYFTCDWAEIPSVSAITAV